MLATQTTMAGENEDYDLLEDVGEEVDYDDYTLEDEDLGECLRRMASCDCMLPFSLATGMN